MPKYNTIDENLLDKFEDAVLKRYTDEQYENADPNRESAAWARSNEEKWRIKLLNHMKKLRNPNGIAKDSTNVSKADIKVMKKEIADLFYSYLKD